MSPQKKNQKRTISSHRDHHHRRDGARSRGNRPGSRCNGTGSTTCPVDGSARSLRMAGPQRGLLARLFFAHPPPQLLMAAQLSAVVTMHLHCTQRGAIVPDAATFDQQIYGYTILTYGSPHPGASPFRSSLGLDARWISASRFLVVPPRLDSQLLDSILDQRYRGALPRYVRGAAVGPHPPEALCVVAPRVRQLIPPSFPLRLTPGRGAPTQLMSAAACSSARGSRGGGAHPPSLLRQLPSPLLSVSSRAQRLLAGGSGGPSARAG